MATSPSHPTENGTAETRVEAPTVLNPNGDFPLCVYFGHHKCASSWIDSILREICCHMGLTFRIIHRPLNFRKERTLNAYVRQRKVDVLAYTNANLNYVKDLPFFRGFHVVRDPRDILVSAYFSHLYSHDTTKWPELAAYREKLQNISKDEGLYSEMEFSRWVFEEMYGWDYRQEHVLELKMEHLTANPAAGFVEIARFLGILDEEDRGTLARLARTARLRLNRLNFKGRRHMPGNLPVFPVPRRRLDSIPAAEIERIVKKMSFARLTKGRRRGQENVKSHYRKGVPGDWKHHFSDAHKRVFKDKFGDLLVKLGYEENNDW